MFIFRSGFWILVLVPALYVFARLWAHIIGHVLHGGGVWIVVVAVAVYVLARFRRHSGNVRHIE
jgi:hypothetical protein